MVKPRKSRPSDGHPSDVAPTPAPGTTGRFIVRFHPGGVETGTRALHDLAGVRAFSTAETKGTIPENISLEEKDVVFHALGLAVISAPPEAASAVRTAAADTGIASMRPEMLFYPVSLVPMPAPGTAPVPTQAPPPWLVPPVPVQPLPNGQGLSPDYLRGCRDMIDFLNGVLQRGSPPAVFVPVQPVPGMPFPTPQVPGLPGIGMPTTPQATRGLNATATATWGLDAVRATSSSLSGKSVKVCILDSGLDMNHPDFAGRNIQTQSFVRGADGQLEDVQDMVGHGTHCAGTACGPKQSVGGIRYGIAYEADLFIGKVIDNSGNGPESAILAGIQWAMQQECRVVSMSLGIPWPNLAQQPANVIKQIVQDYEDIGQQAIQANVALIAAAGNDSDRRTGIVWPVAIPALASKFMAVGAIDRDLQIAYFSNAGGIPGIGGAVDLVGPGVEVYSSWSQTAQGGRGEPPAGLFATIAGTSMATPHVAGCAALMIQVQPTWRAAEILNALMGTARPLSLSSLDAGRGLVQAAQ